MDDFLSRGKIWLVLLVVVANMDAKEYCTYFHVCHAWRHLDLPYRANSTFSDSD